MFEDRETQSAKEDEEERERTRRREVCGSHDIKTYERRWAGLRACEEPWRFHCTGFRAEWNCGSLIIA